MTALRVQVNAFIAANLSPQARSQRLAALAIQMRNDLIRTGKAGPAYRTFVDGREGAPEAAVTGTGGGTILYRFGYAAEAAVFALAFLRARSPAKSGAFRSSFYVAVDGRFIRAADFNPKSVSAEAEIIIGNTMPYSRRVDVQIAGGRPLRYSVPAGMFDDCARATKRQFGGALTVKRVSSADFPGRYALKGEGRNKKRRGAKVESPAVLIRAFGT